jgi:hypothetical protein
MSRANALGACTTAALLAAALLAAVFRVQTLAPAARADLTLVYVGADDCAPCREWQRMEGSRFLGSPEFARLSYREVKSPTARDVLKDQYWPQDLRRYRDRLMPGAGVPLWLVISGADVVEQGFGASQWHAAVLPRVKSLLR